MKKIIFKSELKAKTYEIRSSKNQGCYNAGELLRVVKTDNIDEVINKGNYSEVAICIDSNDINEAINIKQTLFRRANRENITTQQALKSYYI